MSQAASMLASVETEQDQGLFAFVEAGLQKGQALLTGAELAAAFALFGTKPNELVAEVFPANDRDAVARAFPETAQRRVKFNSAIAARALQTLDWLMILAVIEFAALWGAGRGLLGMHIDQALIYVACGLALKGGLWLTDSYAVAPGRIRPEQGAGGLALGALAGIILANLCAPDPRAAAALAVTLPLAAATLAAVHAAYAVWTGAAYRAGMFAESIIVVGASAAAADFIARARDTGEARVLAIVDDRAARAPDHIDGVPVAGGLERLLQWEGLARVDRIVIAVAQHSDKRLRMISSKLRRAPKRIDLLLDLPVASVRGPGLERLAGAGLACIAARPRKSNAMFKRAFDITLSVAMIVFLAPLLALTWTALRLTGGRPAVIGAPRHGRDGEIFQLFGFNCAPSEGLSTHAGTLLRRARIDALPQLFNVLRGEMSFVGPKPHAPGLRVAGAPCADIVPEYAHRFWVRPGLFSPATLAGEHNAIASPSGLRAEIRSDLAYVAKESLVRDLALIAKAIARAVKRNDKA